MKNGSDILVWAIQKLSSRRCYISSDKMKWLWHITWDCLNSLHALCVQESVAARLTEDKICKGSDLLCNVLKDWKMYNYNFNILCYSIHNKKNFNKPNINKRKYSIACRFAATYILKQQRNLFIHNLHTFVYLQLAWYLVCQIWTTNLLNLSLCPVLKCPV